jgi:ketosteroid isomerase-like protein
MSQENVELLRSVYEAFNRGDFEAVVRAVHPDIEFIRVGGFPPVRGAAAVREWMEPDALEDQRFEPLDFTVNGNKVLVHQHVTGRGAGSGMELDFTSLAVFTLDDDGLVTRLEGFLQHEEAEALKAAGLSE